MSQLWTFIALVRRRNWFGRRLVLTGRLSYWTHLVLYSVVFYVLIQNVCCGGKRVSEYSKKISHGSESLTKERSMWVIWDIDGLDIIELMIFNSTLAKRKISKNMKDINIQIQQIFFFFKYNYYSKYRTEIITIFVLWKTIFPTLELLNKNNFSFFIYLNPAWMLHGIFFQVKL